MKQIDTGGLSFADLRRGDKYYVDKSLLIKDILDDNDRGIYLFTRPRRFGKTTNLSMLDAFFNMKYEGNTWFDDLAISQYPEFDAYRNAFPVVNINLKKSKAQNYESFIKRMRSVVYDAFDEHRYLLETEGLASDQRARFEEVLNEKTDEALISERIPLLCKLLEKHHGKKTVVLIDEYDRAASDSFGSESFRPIMDFLGEFMNSLLKNNDSLQMAYVTGVMQITKESIFSGLNNLKVNNVFSSMSDERFGFTESEIKQALSDFHHPEKFEEAKQWYDGYRFGNAEVYNPFSIMNYISDGFAPMPYWANSGSDWIVRKLLENIDDDNYAEILSLVTGGSVAAELTPTLSFDDVSSEDESLYSLMVVSGYLKAVPMDNRRYSVSVPNNEVHEQISRLMSRITPINTGLFKRFAQAVLTGDADTMTDALQRILMGGDYLNLRENAYEMVLMTVMQTLWEKYDVRTEVKEGYGRTDILMRSRSPNYPNLIFELKCTDSDKDLEKGAKEAMAQIHEKRYYLGMPGKVVLYGVCFCSKKPKVIVEAIDNGPEGLSYVHPKS